MCPAYSRVARSVAVANSCVHSTFSSGAHAQLSQVSERCVCLSLPVSVFINPSACVARPAFIKEMGVRVLSSHMVALVLETNDHPRYLNRAVQQDDMPELWHIVLLHLP